MTIEAGEYYKLRAIKKVEFGWYLDGGEQGEILLPKRFVPDDIMPEMDVEVFIYHDSENRLIATTQHPAGEVGDIVLLTVVSVTPQGAFLDWGLMKDIFLPVSQQSLRPIIGGKCLVRIYRDTQTGRVAVTEKFANTLTNEELTVKELEPVSLTIWHKTDIGYKVIINNQYTGVLHFNDVFRELETGDQMKGFIKKIIPPDNRIDVALGDMGYARTEDATEKIMRLLQENNGYLPYHDKSTPEEIYSFFSISKKTFKMALGSLYKQKKIELTQTGIKTPE